MASSTPTSAYRWLSAPAPPAVPGGYETHELTRPDGARIVYLEWNAQSRSTTDALGPVLFLHGGLASSECWAHQIAHVLRTYRPGGADPWIVSIDSRGQGRSSFGKLNYPPPVGGAGDGEGEGDKAPTVPQLTYTQMGDDTVAVLDALGVRRARIVGWSDGAILCLDLLLRYASRIGSAYAFAANYDTNGLYAGPPSPATDESNVWARAIYERVNDAPDWDTVYAAVLNMWHTNPSWKLDEFKRAARAQNPPDSLITTTTPGVPNDTSRLWLVDGDHEEAVAIEQNYELAKVMPQTTLLILPAASHFAMVQDPETFNKTLDAFLAYKPPVA